MVGFPDLSNEILLMIWDLVELEDVYTFSTISKNVYLLTHELLCEHYRLGRRLSNINFVSSEPGVYRRVLKEILLNPRASRYPLLLNIDLWAFAWEETGPYSRAMVPESDLALFKQAVRENIDVSNKELEDDWYVRFRVIPSCLVANLGYIPSCGNKCLPCSLKMSHPLGEIPNYGGNRIFVFPKIASLLGLLPRKTDADSEMCVGLQRSTQETKSL